MHFLYDTRHSVLSTAAACEGPIVRTAAEECEKRGTGREGPASLQWQKVKAALPLFLLQGNKAWRERKLSLPRPLQNAGSMH